MQKEYNCKLIFEDGNEYLGYSFGDRSERVCEIVFNTSMVGYQEILSDPSYTYQAVVIKHGSSHGCGVKSKQPPKAYRGMRACKISRGGD